ncbi:Transposase-like protein [Neochlamydia sp. EPS4]|nr:Transposase-like protein [Neochlamydia sp. EPS4]
MFGKEETMFVASYHTIKELNALSKKKASASYSLKLRAVAMAMEGESASQIGKTLGYCTSAIQKWIRRYNHHGLEGLIDRRPIITGRKRALTPEQEKAFLTRVEKGPEPCELLKVYHLSDLQFILKEEFGKKLTLPGVWGILRRFSYPPLTLRLQRYKANPKEQKKLKKIRNSSME